MNKIFVDPNNAGSEEYKIKLQKIAEQGVDPFSKEHLQKFDKKNIIYETKHWFVFENQHSYRGTKRQFVIVCQQYKENLNQLSIGEMNDLFAVASHLCDKYNIPGGGLTMRFGDTAKSGATVTRLHAQIIEPEENKKVAAWFGSEKK